jgi:hypothetical protein
MAFVTSSRVELEPTCSPRTAFSDLARRAPINSLTQEWQPHHWSRCSEAVARKGQLVFRFVGCLPRAAITSERHRSEGQASDKPQGTKPRAQLRTRPQAESAYGYSAAVHVPMIAA